jgi:uncharacterized membrane-anchored protein
VRPRDSRQKAHGFLMDNSMIYHTIYRLFHSPRWLTALLAVCFMLAVLIVWALS